MENIEIFHPSDLLHKLGFEDGEQTARILQDWADTSYWKNRQDNKNMYMHIMNYLSPVALQAEIVVKYIKPLLPAKPESRLERVYTIHNPIRLEPVISDDTPEYEELLTELENAVNCIPEVTIPNIEIHTICETIFPKKPNGWLALYSNLAHQFKVLSDIKNTQNDDHISEYSFIRYEPYKILPSYLDGLLKNYDDADMQIASELIYNETSTKADKLSLEDVNKALYSAALLLK